MMISLFNVLWIVDGSHKWGRKFLSPGLISFLWIYLFFLLYILDIDAQNIDPILFSAVFPAVITAGYQVALGEAGVCF